MDFKLQIFDMIKKCFKHNGMPDITQFPTLIKSNFKSNLGCYIGLHVYFTVAIDYLSRISGFGTEIGSCNQSVASQSLQKFRNLATLPIFERLLKNVPISNDDQQKMVHLFQHAETFFYSFSDRKNPLYKHYATKFSNRPRILNIEGEQFFYDPKITPLKDILLTYVPSLPDDQKEYYVMADSKSHIVLE